MPGAFTQAHQVLLFFEWEGNRKRAVGLLLDHKATSSLFGGYPAYIIAAAAAATAGYCCHSLLQNDILSAFRLATADGGGHLVGLIDHWGGSAVAQYPHITLYKSLVAASS